MNSYLLSILVGILVYAMMVLDNKYIDPKKDPVSPKIPMFVTLILWLICEFYLNAPKPLPLATHQALKGGFYA